MLHCWWFQRLESAANPMTKISDSPKIFTLDVELSDQDTVGLEYKYCAGPSWKYEQTESANFKFWQMTEEGDVVTSFKNYWDPGQESDVTICSCSSRSFCLLPHRFFQRLEFNISPDGTC
jgi:hypothetical protein